MNSIEPAALSALERSLGEAIELAKQARFGELTAKAEGLESGAAALGDLRNDVERSGPRAAGSRQACERIRRKLFVLAEIFRHAAAAQAGLLGLHQTITTPYAASGRLPAASNPFAMPGRVDQEA